MAAKQKPQAKKQSTTGCGCLGAIAAIVVIVLIASAIGGSNSGSPASAAKRWITQNRADTNDVQTDVLSTMVDVGIVQGAAATLSNVAQVVQQAQSGESDIGSRNNDLWVNACTSSDKLCNAEQDVADAAGGLKKALSHLVAYLGNPNPVALGTFRSAYANATGEWNYGVTTLWHLAHRADAPTITEAQINKVKKLTQQIAKASG